MPDTKAKTDWDKANTRIVSLKLNAHTDADIITWLAKQPSKQGAIREVLKNHIAKAEA